MISQTNLQLNGKLRDLMFVIRLADKQQTHILVNGLYQEYACRVVERENICKLFCINNSEYLIFKTHHKKNCKYLLMQTMFYFNNTCSLKQIHQLYKVWTQTYQQPFGFQIQYLVHIQDCAHSKYKNLGLVHLDIIIRRRTIQENEKLCNNDCIKMR
ncbi:unnamed protein product [Paramecium octaurelia]|uniref:Uncharacterized protein n=1 Tax=Paramecium octaurelia TaxID=43137 RepID=A0A8S1YKY3_PAROT|nr:unnamed protein product [Paramecium octaurelia]